MPGGREIVPVGGGKATRPAAAPSALQLALSSQQEHFAKKYDEIQDDIVDETKDKALTSKVKHLYSDDPNWMVDAITGACVCVFVSPPQRGVPQEHSSSTTFSVHFFDPRAKGTNHPKNKNSRH
jgi:hypothetical protein